MERISAIFLIILFCTLTQPSFAQTSGSRSQDMEIGLVLDSFHKAAAEADFEKYFAFFADSAIFIGTDATERWQKKDFMVWAKPFFDRGKAWRFTALSRHISLDETSRVAWFDELLDTQMKICRGSGVLVKQGNDWKIKQYVLSMTVPNNVADSVIKIKSAAENILLDSLRKRDK